MRAIAVVNQKGGCGKTITSINLSAFLALQQRRVLLIDLDPQGHASLGVRSETSPPARTVADLFQRDAGPVMLRDLIEPVRENLDLVPADILLSAAPERLAGVPGRERILSQALDSVAGRYDYVIVDCPPHVGLLTFNALIACAEAIVPMDPSFFALHGVGKLLETFQVVERDTGHHIDARALVTLYAGRSPFARAVLDDIRRHLAGRYFETVIRHSIKLAEAASHGRPIAHYSERCAGYDDYRALADEVIRHEAVAMVRDGVAAPLSAPPASPMPVVTSDGVVFVVEAPHAARVQLVGDFNEWALDGTEMEPAGRMWTKVVKLQPGRYRYRYVVDGQWQADPLNAIAEPCPYGGHNSIVQLDAASLSSASQ
jgi:chromosome partitioning protein